MADHLAYGCHDLDDGRAAGLLSWQMFDAQQPAWWLQIRDGVNPVANHMAPDLARRFLKRYLLNLFVSDLIEGTAQTLERVRPTSADAVRAHPVALPALSAPNAALRRSLHEFLTAHLYRHPQVETMWVKAQRLLTELFHSLDAAPEQLPEIISARIGEDDSKRRVICDYIADMTDRKAVQEHRRLFQFDLQVLP